MKKTKRKPTLLEAVISIVSILVIIGIGYGKFKLKIEPLILLASFVAAMIALRVGVTWEEMMEEVSNKVKSSMSAIFILIVVGLLIGTWMLSGTIPMLIYYGIQIINPKFLLVTAFLVTALVSTCTGTSYGSVGTVGVALMGIAMGLGVSLPAAAGACVSGAYFGDKLSPLSDTTNIAPIAAGSNLYDHIKHMLYTTVPASIFALIVYAIAGMNSNPEGMASPEKITIMLETLNVIFNWNILLVIPPIIVVYGSIKKYPTVPIMLLSSIIAGIMGITIQMFTVTNLFEVMVNGFNTNMVKIEGFDPTTVIWEVTRLINRGGMSSMMGTVLLTLCALVFGGIVTSSGSLGVILEKIMKSVKTTGQLVLATVISCVTMALVTCNSYLAILIPGELFKDVYKERGLAAKNLSRTLEDSGTVVVPLVPWSIAGVYMATTLGVPTLEYLPWAIMNYTGIIFAIIYGFTGIGIAKIEDEVTIKNDNN